MWHALSALLQGVALLLLLRTANAQKYNLTGSVKAMLVASNEPPGAECDIPGICIPTNVSIPTRTLWYWCGFKTTHRTIYQVSSVGGSNISNMYMMRESQLEDCALKNVTFVNENCVFIPESTCSSKPSCNVRLYGLVFPDNACFVIINNGKSNLTVTVKLNNFFDRPRYYGTIFVLFFAITGGLAIVANVAWQFYNIIIAPVNHHHEPIKVKRDDPITKDVESDSSKASGGGPSAILQNLQTAWTQKVLTMLRPSRHMA